MVVVSDRTVEMKDVEGFCMKYAPIITLNLGDMTQIET